MKDWRMERIHRLATTFKDAKHIISMLPQVRKEVHKSQWDIVRIFVDEFNSEMRSDALRSRDKERVSVLPNGSSQ